MFNLIRKTPMPYYEGVGYFYRHDLTGMEVFFIKNNSEELTGAFTFATPSQDNTGLAHILEHTVLSGSERFPVKDPFSEIYLSSPNTFLNAMTFCDKTMYPFSSPLKKDFDIIFDIYADAVFAPLLRKQSFEQEGVRFFNGKVDGVVFNEMLGARSSEDEIVNAYCVNKLFKDTPYQYDSGGNPVHIPDLTYQKYLERYRYWYSPSNCRMFMFGNLNIEEYFNKLEERYLFENNLTRWDGVKIITGSADYSEGQFSPQRDSVPCAAKAANSVVLTWLTKRADDPVENLSLSILTDILLGNPGAVLYKAITDSDLGEDLNPMSGMDSEYPILPFTVGFVNAKKNSEDRIEQFLLSELKKIADNGIDSEEVEAAMKRQAFKLREIQGGSYPYGVICAMRACRYWLRGQNVEACMDNEAIFRQLQNEVSKGKYFENWIMENLVNNPRRCLLTVYGDKDFEKSLKKILDKKYNDKILSLDKAKYQIEFDAFETFVKTEDSEEALRKIPRITKDDLPCRIPKFDLEEVVINKVPVKTMPLFTRGITYLNFAFDVTALSENEKNLLPLLIRLMQMCSTKKHNYSKIGTLIKLHTGGFSITQNCATKADGKPLSLVFVKSKALDEDVENALDIISEILIDSDVRDTKRIEASVTDLVTDFESSYLESANAFATIRASSGLSAISKEAELSIGTEGYLFLKELGDDCSEIAIKLDALKQKIFTRKRMTVQIACDEEQMDSNLDKMKFFINVFPEGTDVNDLSFYSSFTEAISLKTKINVSGGPSYNSIAFPLSAKNEDELTAAMLYSSVISAGYLFETVRGKNGAYGAESHVDLQERIMSMSSYRDPGVSSTYKIFEEALSREFSQNDIDYTVVTIIGKELKPVVPKYRCFEAFRRSLYGMTDALYLERRMAILSKTPEDMKRISQKLLDDYHRCCCKTSICGSEVKDDSHMFDDAQILNLSL